MFIKNAWYVAAMAEEIGRTPLARTICNQDVVLYRREDGQPVAIDDECPHRRYRLSKGTLIGDTIECAYHGFRFDCTGACTHIPGQDNIPPKIQVRTFPVVEKWRWIWIWPGDPALAEPETIPDHHWNDAEGWTPTGGLLELDCNYELQSDNLLDLSHEAFVHKKTIGNPAVAETPITSRVDGDVVHVDRIMRDVPPPPLFAKVCDFAGNIDRYQLVRFEPPANIWIDARAYPAGTEDADRGMRWVVMNSITPGTIDTAHYFWSISRCFEIDDDDLTGLIHEQLVATITEDKDVLEEQQRIIAKDDPTGAKLNAAACDAGNVYARRIVSRLLAAEGHNAEAAAE